MGSSASAIDPTDRPEDSSAQLGPAAAKPAVRKPAAAAAAAAASPKPSKLPPPVHRAPGPAKPAALPKRADPPEEDSEPSRIWLGLAGFFHGSASWLISCLVHLSVLIILGLWFLPSPNEQEAVLLSAHVEGENPEMLEEFEELEQLEFDEMTDVSMVVEDPGLAALGEPAGVDAEAEVEVGSLAASDTLSEIGALFGKDGHGYSTIGEGTGGAEFYGVKARGRKFVFVVDNSLSMNGGRFEAACFELLKTVSKMGNDQSFYVFFFSDTDYPLFHPHPAKGMVPASKENVQRLQYWLDTVHLVLKTNALSAVEKALAMKPDAIYILTDGAFTDRTKQFLLDMETVDESDGIRRGPTIHTVGMEVQPQHGQSLQEIAKHHYGTYRFVMLDPRLKTLAKRRPRGTHREEGAVWGVALGNAAPKRPAGNQGGGKKKGGGKKGN